MRQEIVNFVRKYQLFYVNLPVAQCFYQTHGLCERDVAVVVTVNQQNR